MLLGRPFLALYPFGFVVALALAAILTPFAGLLARRLGIVAAPRPDRWSQRPTPMLGGIAIFAAIALAFAFVPQPIQEDRWERYGFLAAGAALIFALGLYDDLKRLPPYTKLLGQIVAACVLVFGQLHLFGRPDISPLMVPFAIIWIVGVTNAFNLLDNMDGLSSGIAVVVGLTIAGLSHVEGDRQTALVALAVSGAAAGFLLHNFNPARIFMGDSGSLVLGYVLSGLTVLGAAHGSRDVALTLVLPVFVMALPLLDTSLVTVMRSLNGRSIAQGGRDHLSHRLVALGLSERQAVLVLYAVAGLAGTLAVASRLVGMLPTLALWALFAAGLVLFGAYLGQVRIYSEADLRRIGGPSRLVGRMVLGGRYLLYKQQVAAMLLDLLLVMASLLAAFLLRFEGRLDPLYLSTFARMLPIAVCAWLGGFLVLGVYRTVWRHMGLADAWLIARACLLGAAVTGGAFVALFGFEAFPISVMLINLLLIVPAVIASRRSFEFLNHLVAQGRHDNVTRVLLVGAGDAGELALRAMQRSQRHAYRAVGMLAEEDRYLHRTVHGIPVLGRIEDLDRVVTARQVDQVVVVLIGEELAESVMRHCADLGIPSLDLASLIKAELLSRPALGAVS